MEAVELEPEVVVDLAVDLALVMELMDLEAVEPEPEVVMDLAVGLALVMEQMDLETVEPELEVVVDLARVAEQMDLEAVEPEPEVVVALEAGQIVLMDLGLDQVEVLVGATSLEVFQVVEEKVSEMASGEEIVKLEVMDLEQTVE